jgi:hypothetical protein
LIVKEPTQDIPHISIFTGPFGTGKTEVAINYALRLADRHESVTLTDMDVVTPYFRSRDMAERLQARGIEVVSPPEITKRVHLPAVSARIWGSLQRANGLTVIDVGGDAQGARAMGQFNALLERTGYTMYLVVNPYRPFNATVERIAETLEVIETNSRLEAGALVSNPNLIGETTLDVVRDGHRMVERAGSDLGLPIAFLCLESRLLEEDVEGFCSQPILPLKRHFLPPWEE